MMDNRQIIGKLRECAKGLLDVARELQRAKRMESPRTLEIVRRQIEPKAGAAHEFNLPFVVGVDEFGNDLVLELSRPFIFSRPPRERICRYRFSRRPRPRNSSPK